MEILSRAARLALVLGKCACVLTLCVLTASVVRAQNATVIGQVLMAESGQPVAFATVSVLSQGTQQLASESGRFLLTNVPVGPLRLRFKRMGFEAKDTTLTIVANDTIRLRVSMTRLVIQLPTMLVSGVCTNQTPFETKPENLAELLDQVNQNAERMRLFAREKPFTFQAANVYTTRDPNGKLTSFKTDTASRGPMPLWPYRPNDVIRGNLITMPELPAFADTAFTNNHCFHYAGQTRIGSDSVIMVDFEPVPWLAEQADLKGTMYLRVDGYHLLEVFSTLNRIPKQFPQLREYTVRARFNEIALGVPVLDSVELVNIFRDAKRRPFVMTTKVFNIRFGDSTSKPLN